MRYQGIALACILALTGFLAGVSARDSFPYCDCIRPEQPDSSPYLLTPNPSKTLRRPDGSARLCWDLTVFPYATGPCAKFDLRKIELDMKAACQGAVKSITFGSTTVAPSYARYHGGTGKQALVLKVTYGNRNLASYAELLGKTTLVCIDVAANKACDTAAELCTNGQCDFAYFSPDKKCCPGGVTPSVQRPPSPPPPSPRPPSPRPPSPSPPPPSPSPPSPSPPPPSPSPPSPSPPPPSPSPPTPPPPTKVNPFPFCACSKYPVFTNYQLSAPASTAGNRYCFQLSAKRYTGPETKCVNFDLRKIEFNIRPGCHGAVSSITLGDQVLSPSYTRYYTDNAVVLKLTRGSGNLATLDSVTTKPLKLCLTLRTGTCSTLAKLCASPYCQVAYFSPDKKCCPLQTLVNPSV